MAHTPLPPTKAPQAPATAPRSDTTIPSNGIATNGIPQVNSTPYPEKPHVPQTPPANPHGVSQQRTTLTDQPDSVQTDFTADNNVPDISFSASSQTPSPHTSSAVLPDDLAAQWRRTKCTQCGFVHEGATIMTRCPRCSNTDPDTFDEVD